MAFSSHAACHSFLTVRRVPMVAARRSSAERFMRTRPTQSRSRGKPGVRSPAWPTVADLAGLLTGGGGSTTLRVIAPPLRRGRRDARGSVWKARARFRKRHEDGGTITKIDAPQQPSVAAGVYLASRRPEGGAAGAHIRQRPHGKVAGACADNDHPAFRFQSHMGRYSGPNEWGSSCATVWLSGVPSTPWLATTTSWSANSRMRWRQPPHGVTGAAPGPVTYMRLMRLPPPAIIAAMAEASAQLPLG